MYSGVAGRRFALPISGGLDSRSTVAALDNEASSSDLYAFSYGYAKYSSEIRIAQQIAEARHLPFEKIVLQPYLFKQIHSITAALEGYQDITQCRQAAVATHLGLHADSVVAAHWGDVWFDSSGADPRTPTAELALKKFTKPGHAWLMQNLVNNNASQAYSDSQELIRAQVNGYAQIVDTDFRLKAVKTDLWSARWTTASLRAYQTGLFPFLPFYDTRIADFFSTVPCDYLPGRKLQIAFLKRYAPDLARITWQVYDANLYCYQYFNTWQIPRRAIKKIWRTISRQRTPERNWEVQFLHPAGRAGLEHWLLAPGLKLHNLIPVQEIRSLLDDLFAKPNRETGYAASMLLTFSAWLEQYG